MAQTRHLFVSDIFGLTPALKQLLEVLSVNPLHTKTLDPYAGQQQHFSSEHEAYQKFQTVGGIKGYINTVKDTILDLEGLQTIVGFSVGGAAIWKGIEGLKKISEVKIVLFYPGQIRHYLDVETTFPTTIIWPSHEPHFELNDVIKYLQHKKNVESIHTAYSHGFMNLESANYSETAYLHYAQYLRELM